jgi:hypothetical protein
MLLPITLVFYYSTWLHHATQWVLMFGGCWSAAVAAMCAGPFYSDVGPLDIQLQAWSEVACMAHMRGTAHNVRTVHTVNSVGLQGAGLLLQLLLVPSTPTFYPLGWKSHAWFRVAGIRSTTHNVCIVHTMNTLGLQVAGFLLQLLLCALVPATRRCAPRMRSTMRNACTVHAVYAMGLLVCCGCCVERWSPQILRMRSTTRNVCTMHTMHTASLHHLG